MLRDPAVNVGIVTLDGREYMPAAAERRLAPREPGALWIALNLGRFAATLAGVALAVVTEGRTPDPITLVPCGLSRRPLEEAALVGA